MPINITKNDATYHMIHNQYNIIIAIAVIAIVSFCIVSLLSGPLGITNGLITLAYLLMAGPTYGILQDIISANRNIEYFLFGHQPGQQTFVQSDIPLVQASIWGMAATFLLTLIVALIAFIVACCLPISPLVLPMMTASLPLLLAFNEIIAASCLNTQRAEGINEQSMLKYVGPYIAHQLKNSGVLGDDNRSKNWFRNGNTHLMAYITLPLLSIGALVALFTAPLSILSTPITLIITVGTAALNLLFLVVCKVYSAHNKDTWLSDYTVEHSNDDLVSRGYIAVHSKRGELWETLDKTEATKWWNKNHKNYSGILPGII